MKRKNTGTTDLRAFLKRAAAKKGQPEPNSVTPSSNESQMQLVIFQGQSGSGTQTVPPEPERAPSTDTPIIEEEDDESRAQDESDSSLAELSMMLVKTGRALRYDIVYKLLKLVLVLPVATAGVERVFSSMNYIKNKLRSKMGQKYLNDCLVTFIERDFLLQVKDEDIITHFQSIKNRKVIL